MNATIIHRPRLKYVFKHQNNPVIFGDLSLYSNFKLSIILKESAELCDFIKDVIQGVPFPEALSKLKHDEPDFNDWEQAANERKNKQ